MEAAGCSKASASDIRRGKQTPHVSTWGMLGTLVDAMVESTAQGADTYTWRSNSEQARSAGEVGGT
jgi:hypothetical protein